MPIVAKQGEIRTKNLIDGEEFDNIYNSHVDVLNAGMDRENLPSTAFTFDKFKDYAFHQYYHTYVKMPEDLIKEYNEVTPNTGWDGMIYEDYVGSWIYNTKYPLNIQAVEGNLHIEFNCWYWFDQTAITGNTSGDWVQFAVLLNDNVVAETHFLYQSKGQVHLVASVPVATGPQEISIAFKLPSRNSSSTLNTQMFYYSGGNLLAINRYR
jgi:hypothetical protein